MPLPYTANQYCPRSEMRASIQIAIHLTPVYLKLNRYLFLAGWFIVQFICDIRIKFRINWECTCEEGWGGVRCQEIKADCLDALRSTCTYCILSVRKMSVLHDSRWLKRCPNNSTLTLLTFRVIQHRLKPTSKIFLAANLFKLSQVESNLAQ